MESRHITLDLGNVSLSETLGSYYIEMRPALVHCTNSIYRVKPRLERLRRMWHGTGSS
jgi:hypothetical protein